MATHLVLSTEHILLEISSHFACSIPDTADEFRRHFERLDKRETEKRRTLVSAALTCVAFSDPASKVLWQSLYGAGLAPLIRAWENMRAKQPHDSGRSLSEEQWTRLDQLAARVRCVACKLSPEEDNLPLPLLERHEVVFPNLRVLGWYDGGGDPSLAPQLRALASSTVTTVFFFDSYRYPAPFGWTTEVKTVVERCDKIRHLIAWSPGVDVLHYWSGLPPDKLRAFEVYSLSTRTVEDLARFQRLEFLTASSIPFSSVCNARLPTLRRLRLIRSSTIRLEMLLSLLDCVPRLHDLEAHMLIDEKKQDARAQLSAFCANPIVQRLTIVKLHLTFSHGPAQDVPLLELIRPLLSLPVHCLTVDSMARYTPSVSSQDLEIMSCAWSRLASFIIRAESIAPGKSALPAGYLKPSLSSVLAFAMACRELTVLIIDRIEDASPEELAGLEETYLAVESASGTQANLVELRHACEEDRFRATIADPERLERIVRALFPRLRDFGPRSRHPPR